MSVPSNHPRNVGPMLAARRCGARTRSGGACAAPSVTGAARCRMHGGKGSGAPRDNRNAFKHGCFTGYQRAQDAEVRQHVRDVEALLVGLAAQRRQPS